MSHSEIILNIVIDRAKQWPDRIAFIYLADGETVEETITYKNLHDRAVAIAASLRQAGLQPGERVLLVFPQGLAFIEAFFGCLFGGYVAVPIAVPGKNRGTDKVAHIVSNAGVGAALTLTKTRESLRRLAPHSGWATDQLHWICTDALSTVSEPHTCSFPMPTAGQLAFLQYTSGSTGHPKGVMVSHGNILANSAFIQHSFQTNEQSVSVCWLPSFHDMGLIDGIIQPLYSGFTAVLLNPVHVIQKPIRWLRALSRYKGTYSGAPNFAFDFCVDRTQPDERQTLDLSSIEHLYNAAEPIRAATMERFLTTFATYGLRPEALFTSFGLAESTLAVTMCRRRRPPTRLTVDTNALEQNKVEVIPHGRTLVSSGWPMTDSILRIVDPTSQRVCSPNEVGEIWTLGPSVGQGYWQQPELTEAVFQARTNENEGPFLRTGDLGFIGSDGSLFVTGRLKDVIIIRGVNHYPQDIELTVEQSHPALQNNAGAAFRIEVDEVEGVVVVQELKRTYLLTVLKEEVIQAILRQISLQHGISPAAVVLLPPNGVPKTSSGKIQRNACRQAFITNKLPAVHRWETTALATAATDSQYPLLPRFIPTPPDHDHYD